MPGFDEAHILGMAALASSDGGQDSVDAAIRSAALMLDHLGQPAAADRIAKAISTYVAEHPTGTPFPSTVAVGDAIAERL